MKINPRDAAAIADLLDQAQKEGDSLICYWEGASHFKAHDIKTFSYDYDALEYCYEMTTGVDEYSVVPLIPILKVAKYLSQAFTAIEGLDGTVSLNFDIALIVHQYEQNEKLIATIMNENIEKTIEEKILPLEKQFKYSGMEGISREDLIRNVTEGKDSFSLEVKAQFGNVSAIATPNCTLSKQGNYFANNYDMTVQPEGKPSFSRNYKFKRAVPVIKKNEAGEDKKEWINSTVTFKEAFNQMMGRSFNKDYVYVDEKNPENNRKFNAWEYIDFKNPDANGNYPAVKVYNFDIEKEMAGYNLKWPNKEAEVRFIESLKRGNCQIADHVKADGTTEKIYFEANPKHATVNKYDKNMVPILLSIKTKQAEGIQQDGPEQQQGKEIGKDNKKSVKEGLDGDGDDPGAGEKEKKPKRKKGISG